MIEFQPREMRLKGLIRVRGAPAPPDHRNAAVPEIGDRHDLGERPPATIPADVKQTDTLHHIGRQLGDAAAWIGQSRPSSGRARTSKAS